MEKEFEGILGKDETLLWSGNPEPFTEMNAEYKSIIRETIIFWAAVLVIVEACCIGPVLALPNKAIAVAVLLVPVIICGLFVLNHIKQSGKVKKLVYALTDKNIIVKGKTTKVCPYSDIVYCDIEEDNSGTKSLVCGTLTDHIGRGLDVRSLTMLCLGRSVKGSYLAESLAMYSLSDEAIAILKEKLPIGKRF